MSRSQTSIHLPKSLLDELDNSSGNHRSLHNRHASRKESRRQNRVESKLRRAEHLVSVRSLQKKRQIDDEHVDTPERKKIKTHQPSSQSTQNKGKTRPNISLEVVERSGEPTQLGASSRSKMDQQEDAYILYLESKLGWRKNGSRTGSYGASLNEDGLDDLLIDLDKFETSQTTVPGGGLTEGSVDESSTASENESSYEEGSDDTDYEEWGGFCDSMDTAESPEIDVEVGLKLSPEPQSKPGAGSRYIPPQMRKIPAGDDHIQSEGTMKLNKQLKGLLNRLSEQNISSIIDSIEEIYRNNRRHDVTSALTTLIIDGISSHSIHLDAYVVLYAALVASLHRLVGVDFVAFFVQSVVSSYETFLASVDSSTTTNGDTEEVHGKEASNLIVLLSELYNFQVLSCILVYDIIRGLLNQPNLTEYNVELLLKITRSSGLQLRQDDPTALKDIIQMVHSKIAETNAPLSSRTNFMIETLTNLKNNKLKKAVGGGAGGSGGQEAVDRLKKFLSGMNKKRHSMSHEPLRVTLDDLHSAKTKGKWWLVGAAWNGDPLVDNRANLDQYHIDEGRSGKNEEDKLIKLAKKQGMNTDIRRSVFVIIMSSEDYVDACERLGQLKLTEVQQREIVRVLLHCCGNEKSYNPYYTLICQQLCRISHSYTVTLQFCMWDFLRELGETNVGGIELLKRQNDESVLGDGKSVGRTKTRNLARAYAWWIAKDCCTLSILKPVDFTVLKTQAHTFLKELLHQIFISSQISTPIIAADTESLLTTSSRNRADLEDIFKKVTRIETLAMGLLYFISEAFKKELRAENSSFLGWAVEVANDTLRTGVDVAPNL